LWMRVMGRAEGNGYRDGNGNVLNLLFKSKGEHFKAEWAIV